MDIHSRHGFTIIEILVTITVIAIMASVGAAMHLNLQKQSRDGQRAASATVVSESLEKYYAAHGEYPNVASVTAPDPNSVKELLGITNINSLIIPNLPSGSTTNAWKAGAASATNKLAYSANTDTDPACLTGPTGPCIDYRIQYYQEYTGTVKTIVSRNKSIAAPPLPTAPGVPTLVVELNGSNVVATASGATCTGGATPQYAFSTRTNDGAWSAYTGWSATTANSTAAAQGVKYGYQVKANCTNGAQTSIDSPIASEVTYTHPILAPAAPTINQSTTGTITTFSVNTITCPAGTTAQVQYRLTTDWGYNGAWTAPGSNGLIHNITTANEGYEYVDEAQARCTNSFDTSPWSASDTDSYIRAVTAPGGASNYVGSMNAGATQFTWSWTMPSCHASVSRAMYYNYYVGGGWTINGSAGWKGWNSIVGSYSAIYFTPSAPATTFTAGGFTAMSTEWYCVNTTTGRLSANGPRIQSATYTYNP